MTSSRLLSVALLLGCLLNVSYARAQETGNEIEAFSDADGDHENMEMMVSMAEIFGCAKATAKNLVAVDDGNKKLNRFLVACAQATSGSKWCSQLVRPNPSSSSTFSCTYGSSQDHTLVNPDEKTWPYAFLGAKLVDELEAKGIQVALIYNWWRPEPYNKNVGGAAGRHPFGTSVDVRMKTMADMERAHKQLCQWRAQGRIKAVGYYGSTGLHFGVGDKLANTWGKSCPSKLDLRREERTLSSNMN